MLNNRIYSDAHINYIKSHVENFDQKKTKSLFIDFFIKDLQKEEDNDDEEESEENSEEDNNNKDDEPPPLLEHFSEPNTTENMSETPPTRMTTLPKYCVDPLSVIIKLAILSKKEIGSKLCIYNNVFYIQEKGVFQSFVRSYFKNTKEEICYLYNPIKIACESFLVKSNTNINVLFLAAIEGLKKLTIQYQEHVSIVHSLYFYQNIILNYLTPKHNPSLFIEDNVTSYYTAPIVSQLNAYWNQDKIKIVLNMFEFISNDAKNKTDILEEFMNPVDKHYENFFFEIVG
jgi:hypothetical protein